MGGCTHYHAGLSHLTIDPRIPTKPGRSTSGFHRPDRHCLHQARSAVNCWAGRMKGGLYLKDGGMGRWRVEDFELVLQERSNRARKFSFSGTCGVCHFCLQRIRILQWPGLHVGRASIYPLYAALKNDLEQQTAAKKTAATHGVSHVAGFSFQARVNFRWKSAVSSRRGGCFCLVAALPSTPTQITKNKKPEQKREIEHEENTKHHQRKS